MDRRAALITLAAAAGTSLRAATDPHMTAEERAKLLKYLSDSAKEFEALLEGVSPAQWNWKPAPAKWSVAETAAHIAIAEDFLFGEARKALSNTADPDWEKKTAGKTELLERALVNRGTKVQAPEPLNPKDTVMTRDQALARFRQGRMRTIQFAESTQEPLREHLTKGPFPFFDPLNAFHFVLYIPLHNLRHNQQIAEVKATAGYPAS